MELEAVSEQKKNIMKGTLWAGGYGMEGQGSRRKLEPASKQEYSVLCHCRNDEVGAGPARAAGGDICPFGEEGQGDHDPAAPAAGAADAAN